MNDELLAMQAMAAMRDRIVIDTLLTVAAVIGSHALLRAAPLPPRLRALMIDAQLAGFLAAWIGMLIVIGGIIT